MKYRNILIVKLSAIGDVIHALPVSRALKQTYPSIRLTWIVENPSYELLTNNPDLDEIILLEKSKLRSLSGVTKTIPALARQLRNKEFDLVLDLQGLAKSAAIALISGASERLGYCNMREGSWLISKPVCGPHRCGHVVERYLDVARALGCSAGNPEWIIVPNEEEKQSAAISLQRVGLDVETDFVAIAPGTNWQSKCWPTTSFAKLADGISETLSLPIVMIGTEKDRVLVERIKAKSHAQIFDMTGQTTLKQLAFLLQKSRLFVGGDTGPMHLAVAMRTPVVALFGPTDPVRNGPYGSRNIVIKGHVSCAPCYKRTCPTSECMNTISPEDVLTAVSKQLDAIASHASSTEQP